VTGNNLPVTPGQTLYVEVGGDGGFEGGFNGGGTSVFGDGGGGASDIRTDPSTDPGSLASRLLVAGGGGGGGFWSGVGDCVSQGGTGGSAGVDGGDGGSCGGLTPATGGSAGVSAAGGSGGIPLGLPGSLGTGGAGGFSAGSGGGGLYGGGGGGKGDRIIGASTGGGGGGGGSNLVPIGGTATITSDPAAITIAFDICSSGTYSPSGLPPCTAATAGHYVPGDGATSQTACDAGSFQSATGQTSCQAATAGHYVPVPGATGQTPCAAGSYQPLTGRDSCLLAAIGYFVATSGQAAQTACPAGTTSLALGSTSCGQAPAITSTNTATFSVGTAGSFTITTSGLPLSGLTMIGTLPSGVTLHDNGDGTAALGGTPASSSGGTYALTFTASNGVSPNATQSFTLAVIYRFGGFMSPLPRSTLLNSNAAIPVKFVLTNGSGTPIAAATAAALAAAHRVQVTLAGPGISAQSTLCSWTGSNFQCTIRTPRGLLTGTSHPYTITASENLGGGFVTARPTGSAVNPEVIYFR
jgi:hypothetical protein